MASKKQIEANKRNSGELTVPKNTDKKRYNATTHALYAAGFKELLLARLIQEHKPVGELETFLVHCIARDMILQIRQRSL